MTSKGERQASEVVRQAVVGLMERTLSAAARVVDDRTDPEAVHDFRVGLRRLTTVLRAARRLHGKRRPRELAKALGRFGEATNALRDEEVLDETLQAALLPEACRPAIRAWLDERARHEDALREQAVQLIQGGELTAALAAARALAAGKPKKGDEPLPQFAWELLRQAQREVRALLPVAREDTAGMHRLRIRFKRLRYTAEMLGGFMTGYDAAEALRTAAPRRPRPEPHYAAVAKLAARMQKDLGLVHDADVALATVAAADDLDPHARAALGEALLGLRAKLGDRAMERLAQMPVELIGLCE
jgi:CHAD domain-containing protein